MIKTAELTGMALDWALAKALEYEPQVQFDHVFVPALKRGWPISGVVPFDHTDPALCLGLMSKISIMQQANDGSWRVASSCVKSKKHKAHGKTLEQAVARCVVAMHLGDEVDVPSELCEVRSPPPWLEQDLGCNDTPDYYDDAVEM